MAIAVGFVGLGTMGTPMARNVLKSGYSVTVWSRRPETMTPLVAAGAAAGDSPSDVAARSDVIVTMVTDTRAVEDVVLGEHGIARGARKGSVVVDHSTIDPNGARRIAGELQTRGIDMIDAPVSGGSLAADAGTLVVMAGGSNAALERVTPVLKCYGKSIVHIGSSGAGQIAKACNQICVVVNMLGAAEALLLAERAGVDPNVVKDALMAGFAASRMLELQAPKMIARDYEGKIESRLHHKDIHIALEMARALGIDLPASGAAAGVFDTLQQRGGARQDSAAIFSVLDS